VLFEKPGRLPGQQAGRSPYLQAVHVMAPSSLIGEIASVRITGVGANSLFGTLLFGTLLSGTLGAGPEHAQAVPDATDRPVHGQVQQPASSGIGG